MTGSGFFRQKTRPSKAFYIIWFIDDLCSLNNDEFEKNYNDVYCDKLELKKENEDPCKASFFEFSVEVNNRRFTT